MPSGALALCQQRLNGGNVKGAAFRSFRRAVGRYVRWLRCCVSSGRLTARVRWAVKAAATDLNHSTRVAQAASEACGTARDLGKSDGQDDYRDFCFSKMSVGVAPGWHGGEQGPFPLAALDPLAALGS